MECCHFLTVPNRVSETYTNLVVDGRPCSAAVLLIAVNEFVTMALVRFIHTSERGVIDLQCYDARMDLGVCVVLILFSTGARRRVYHYSFAFFTVRYAFDSTLSSLAYCCSV